MAWAKLHQVQCVRNGALLVVGTQIEAKLVLPSISTEGLTKRYGERLSVDSLNLSIYPGELYALLGDNGAGKTTTISMLTTLISPTSGSFHICGFNGLSEAKRIRGLFGVVSQDMAIYTELTVYENLRFLGELYGLARAQIDGRIEDLLRRFGLVDRLNQRAKNLSGGMQRRLAIACAMINEPKVLFMDEPTVGLDPASRRQIWSTLKELKALGVTILLTTHYLEEAELLSDRIGIIRDGRLVAEGTVAELCHKIHGMRGIAVKLKNDLSVDAPEVVAKLTELQKMFQLNIRRDSLRNTIFLSQAAEHDLDSIFPAVLDWLEKAKLPFSKIASGEPNLEEVFMAVLKEPESQGGERGVG